MSHRTSTSGSVSLFATTAPASSILIRLLVGLAVFVPEGIQKLIFPEILGAGRFANIGIPFPEVMGPFVGIVEIVCGALIIAGFLTRLAAIPLIIIMIVALVSTKLPILLGRDVWIFHLAQDIRRTELRALVCAWPFSAVNVSSGKDTTTMRDNFPLCGVRGLSALNA
jgi:uncharacterized membrane protein YphA (DoxX/SURF4 family)